MSANGRQPYYALSEEFLATISFIALSGESEYESIRVGTTCALRSAIRSDAFRPTMSVIRCRRTKRKRNEWKASETEGKDNRWKGSHCQLNHFDGNSVYQNGCKQIYANIEVRRTRWKTMEESKNRIILFTITKCSKTKAMVTENIVGLKVSVGRSKLQKRANWTVARKHYLFSYRVAAAVESNSSRSERWGSPSQIMQHFV